jgi:hypothetical protein
MKQGDEFHQRRLAEAKEEQRRNREYIASCWRDQGVDERVIQKYLETGKLPMSKGIVSVPRKYQKQKKSAWIEQGLIGL